MYYLSISKRELPQPPPIDFSSEVPDAFSPNLSLARRELVRPRTCRSRSKPAEPQTRAVPSRKPYIPETRAQPRNHVPTAAELIATAELGIDSMRRTSVIDVPPALQHRLKTARHLEDDPHAMPELGDALTEVRRFAGLIPRTTCGVCGHVFLLPKLTVRISCRSIHALKKSWGVRNAVTLGHLYGSKEVCCFCAQLFGVYVKEYDAYAEEPDVSVTSEDLIAPAKSRKKKPRHVRRTIRPVVEAEDEENEFFDDTITSFKTNVEMKNSLFSVTPPLSNVRAESKNSLAQPTNFVSIRSKRVTKPFFTRSDNAAAVSGHVSSRLVLSSEDLPVLPLRTLLPSTAQPPPGLPPRRSIFHAAALASGASRSPSVPGSSLTPSTFQLSHVVLGDDDDNSVDAPSSDPVLPEELFDDVVDRTECLIVAVTEYSDGKVFLANSLAAGVDRLRSSLQRRGVHVTTLFNADATHDNTLQATYELCERITRRSVCFICFVGIGVGTVMRGLRMLTTDMKGQNAIRINEIVSRVASITPRYFCLLDAVNLSWARFRSTDGGCVVQPRSPTAPPGALLWTLSKLLLQPTVKSTQSLFDELKSSPSDFCDALVISPVEVAAPLQSLEDCDLPAAGAFSRVFVGTLLEPATKTKAKASSASLPSEIVDHDDRWTTVASSSTTTRWGLLLRVSIGHLNRERSTELIAGVVKMLPSDETDVSSSARFEYHSELHTMMVLSTVSADYDNLFQSSKSVLGIPIDGVYTFKQMECVGVDGVSSSEEALLRACYVRNKAVPTGRAGLPHVDLVVFSS